MWKDGHARQKLLEFVLQRECGTISVVVSGFLLSA